MCRHKALVDERPRHASAAPLSTAGHPITVLTAMLYSLASDPTSDACAVLVWRAHLRPERLCDTAAMLASASEDFCLAAFTMFSYRALVELIAVRAAATAPSEPGGADLTAVSSALI